MATKRRGRPIRPRGSTSGVVNMPTLTFLTGFEEGVISTQGGGLATAMSGVPTIESTDPHSGNYCMKLSPVGSGAVNFRKNTTAPSCQLAVARVYFRIPTGGLPSATGSMVGWQVTTAAVTIGMSITSTGSLRGVVGSGSSITGPTISDDNQWHYVDLRAIISSSTWTLDWSVDGVAQTQATWSGQATNDVLQYLRLGSASSTLSCVICFDDLVMSETSADFPIGPGATKLLIPDGVVTSNVGTNIIEEANGTDANSSSYQALNSVPMGDATNYIRQFANGTGNYLGVSLSDLTDPHSSILGALAVLAYSSGSTSSNRGGCIVSKDSFSSYTTIWGDPSTTADYSDGNTSSPYWKSAIVSGAIDDTTINALQIRMGYSDDASPNPYWIDVAVEVAYVPSNDIDLDLVSYPNTFNAITVLENEIVNLDLVSYPNTFNAITVLENELVNLDLVSYSRTINALSLLENEIVNLDLVSYSSTVNSLTLLEHEIVLLDLVSYSDSVNDLSLLENEILNLDFADYSITFSDISILEDEIIDLDLVSYSLSFEEIVILQEGEIDLDAVSYTHNFYDISVLEDETIDLDVVSFSSMFEDLDLLEEGDILLDLVEYQYFVLNLTTISSNELLNTPNERRYFISKEVRVGLVKMEERQTLVPSEERKIKFL